MAEAKRHELHIDLKLKKKKVHPASVSMNFAVNSYPSVEVVHFTGPQASKKAIEASNEDVFKELGKRQKFFFKERTDPDAEIHLKVDSKEISKVKGYSCNTSYQFSVSNVAETTAFIDEVAIVDAFDSSIYTGALFSDVQSEGSSEFEFGKTPEEVDWSIPKCVVSILQDMCDKGQKSWEDNDLMADEEKKARDKQHELNKYLFDKYIKKIWKKSEKDFGWKDELASMSAECNKLSDDIMALILNKLAGAAGNFLSVMLDIANDFNCLMVPEDGQGSGYKFVNKVKIMEDAKDAKLPVESLSAAAGAYNGMFPILYSVVICKGGVGDVHQEGGSNNLPWICYPKDGPERAKKAAGNIHRVQPPPWLQEVPDEFDVQEDGSNEEESEAPEPSKADKTAQEKKKNFKKTAKTRAEVMREWAKTDYVWSALQSSTATITSPLEKNIKVGNRYTVKDYKGKTLFTGFCNAVSHAVVTQGSQTATSTFRFTHVEFPGFTLPK